MNLQRRTLFAALALVAFVVTAAALWPHFVHERERPIEPGWEAVVATIAGGGIPGPPHNPFAINFFDPFGIASATDGTIYVADGVGAHRIYRITPDGATVLAGSKEGFADGRGVGARFSTPSGLAVDASGHVYVADTGNNAIRRISPDGTVSTIAAADAGLNGPVGVAIDAQGRIIVADTYNDRIVAIDRDGGTTPIAGGRPGFEDGAAGTFHTPCGVAADVAGNIFVADTGNGAVRVISPEGSVSTLATGAGDAPFRPLAVAVAEGSVFVADVSGRVIEITPERAQRTLAGSTRGFADGAGPEALFRSPSGIAVAAPGRLLVTDRHNGVVRLVEARTRAPLRPPAPPMHPMFDAQAFDRTPLLWPFDPIEGPFEVTGTLGESRGTPGAERFHAGVDVHALEGTPVLTVREGAPDDPLAAADFGSLSESVRIGPVAYLHVRVGRDGRGEALADRRFVATRDEAGKVTSIRLKRGARFATGEVIGTVNGFYHAHLNVGWPGEELNPLRFRLTGFADTIPPSIAAIRFLDEDGLPITRREGQRLVLAGRVRIVVDAWDQVNGNEPRRRLGLYRLGYQLLDAHGMPVTGFEQPLETIRFDRHPPDSAARILYASGSGIPAYGNRSTRFLYLVTSTLRDGVAADGALDTSTLAPGHYVVRILAADISGNEALRNRDVPVTITHAGERE